MTIIMILHIRSKYTAVGRKEIVMFFYMYAFISLLAMFLDSGVIPTDNVTYPVRSILFILVSFSLMLMNLSFSKWFAAVYTGLVAAAYCCLLINGFVGFQFAEDGTPLSLWVRERILTLLYFSHLTNGFFIV
jgi:hypothetical protein